MLLFSAFLLCPWNNRFTLDTGRTEILHFKHFLRLPLIPHIDKVKTYFNFSLDFSLCVTFASLYTSVCVLI